MYNVTLSKLSVVRDGFEPSAFHSVVDELTSAPTYGFLGVARARVELANLGYEPNMIPFHHLAIKRNL